MSWRCHRDRRRRRSRHGERGILLSQSWGSDVDPATGTRTAVEPDKTAALSLRHRGQRDAVVPVGVQLQLSASETAFALLAGGCDGLFTPRHAPETVRLRLEKWDDVSLIAGPTSVTVLAVVR
jgi:hypothetical protein